MQKLDNKGRYNLRGVYEESLPEINDFLSNYHVKLKRGNSIMYRDYAKILKLYFKKSFTMIINGHSINFHNKFGKFSIVKTKCTRYNPKKYFFYKNKSGDLEIKKLNIKLNNGYWYFVFWDAPKRLRHYRFNINIKWKKDYMKMVESGFDYLDYTLKNNGRNASHTYINKIK